MKISRAPILRFPRGLWNHRELLWRLTEREVLSRYRGSILGIAWSFITPLAMLAVYTFIFSQVFKARWGGLEGSGSMGFAINLFAGLITFNMFSECANRSPYLVTGNPNYVKKIVFPLEILAAVSIGSALFNAAISLMIMLAFQVATFHKIPATIAWLPLTWLPLLLGTLAISWILAAIGVFLRDVSQVINLLLNMLMFLSPIFFPVSALPQKWQPFLALNPLAQVIEQTRRITIMELSPDPVYIIMGILLGILACEWSYRTFHKIKGAFSDVI